MFSINFQLFEPKKIGFWVKKGKFWKLENFQIWLTSEALVPLLCFPKARKMFVCREELQTMILSTEQPLYHVGEPRYGPPKFFSEFWKMQFLSFESILMCLYHQNGTQWHQLISYGKQWSLWSFWRHLTGKQLVLSLKLFKNTTEKAKIRQTWNRPFFRANLSYKLPSKD